MGKDFEIVAYRGEPLPVTTLARLIQQFTPYAEFFRHSEISSIAKPKASRRGASPPGLHCIAFYDRVDGHDDNDDGGDDDDDSDAATSDDASRSPSAEPPPQRSTNAVYFGESMLKDVKPGASFGSMFQQAFANMRASVKREPSHTPEAESPKHDCPGLVRELSKISGQAWLVGYGDHSCVGIFAEFRNGELVHPTSLAEIEREGEDYIAWPSQQWSAALETTVDLDKVVARGFPDNGPPLFKPDRPDRSIRFDADHYAIGLSESM